MATNEFPTSYDDKTTLVAWDKVWGYDSVAVDNKNFTILAIYNFVIATIDTDDVTEWSTNLWYTEARVTANTTVVSLWTDKADKTNVLELDNTTPFTPDADYEPAPKKYVDDEIASSSLTKLTDGQYITWTDNTTFFSVAQFYWVNTKNRIFTSSANLRSSADTERVLVFDNPYTKIKEMTVWLMGIISVSFDSKFTWTLNPSFSLARIYVNWIAIWTERNNQTSSYITYTEDIVVNQWDIVQLYYSADATNCETTIRNFRLSYDITPILNSAVDLD